MSNSLAPIALCVLFSSCAVMDSVLDAPMSLFDEETGEVVETTVGDAIASSSDGVASVVGDTLGSVNPLLGLLGAAGAGALLSGAKRKKKAAQVVAEAPAETAEEPEAKA